MSYFDSDRNRTSENIGGVVFARLSRAQVSIKYLSGDALSETNSLRIEPLVADRKE